MTPAGKISLEMKILFSSGTWEEKIRPRKSPELKSVCARGPSEAVEGFRCVFYELHTQSTPCASLEIHADSIFVPRRNGFAEDTKEDREASFLNTRDFRRVFPATRQTFSLPLRFQSTRPRIRRELVKVSEKVPLQKSPDSLSAAVSRISREGG